jgi:DNA-binding transcriptional ArsR family regulator
MVHKAEEAADFLKMLSSSTRLMLLCQLLDGERSVGELAQETGQRLTTVSQQLSLLRAHGMVSSRREGATIHYAVAHPAVIDVIRVLYAQFCKDQ